MLDRWKFLICGVGAYLFQMFVLPYVMAPLQNGFATLVGQEYFFDPDTILLIVQDVLLYILPIAILLGAAAFIFMRWRHLPFSFRNAALAAVYFTVTYAICTVIFWVAMLALYTDSAFTALQWNIIGTIDGFQETDGYAFRYALSWILYLSPFFIGPFAVVLLFRRELGNLQQ